MLGFLEGISPFWWLVLALVFGALEMVTTTSYLLWPALAAILLAATVFLFPDISGEWQLTAFAIVSIAMTLGGRWLMSRLDTGKREQSDLNEPSTRAIGRQAELVESRGTEGLVVIDGVRWKVSWSSDQKLAVGDRIEVIDASGLILSVVRAEPG